MTKLLDENLALERRKVKVAPDAGRATPSAAHGGKTADAGKRGN
jgi:hypothetical protein